MRAGGRIQRILPETDGVGCVKRNCENVWVDNQAQLDSVAHAREYARGTGQQTNNDCAASKRGNKDFVGNSFDESERSEQHHPRDVYKLMVDVDVLSNVGNIRHGRIRAYGV